MAKATYYEFSYGDIGIESINIGEFNMSEDHLDLPSLNVRNALISYTKKFDLKRGDLVRFDSELDNYRNDYLFIFNGHDLEDLCSDYDEYGSVPPDYVITTYDFNLFYWKECPSGPRYFDKYFYDKPENLSYNGITHNNIFFLSKEFRQLIVNNIKWELCTWVSLVEIKGIKITVIYDGETDDPDYQPVNYHCGRDFSEITMRSGRKVDGLSEDYKKSCVILAKNMLNQWKSLIMDERNAFDFNDGHNFVSAVDCNIFSKYDNICVLWRFR